MLSVITGPAAARYQCETEGCSEAAVVRLEAGECVCLDHVPTPVQHPDDEWDIAVTVRVSAPNRMAALAQAEDLVGNGAPCGGTIVRHGDVRRASVAALYVDGVATCPVCGSQSFRYVEGVLDWRSMIDNADGVVTFASVGEYGDGNDDPGSVCDGCDTPVVVDEIAWGW